MLDCGGTIRREFPLQTGGNVYYHGAEPGRQETNALVLAARDPQVKLVQQDGRFLLHLDLGPELKQAHTALVTTALLGKAKIPGLPYENADGSPLTLDTDYFGKPRSEVRPAPGPFADPPTGPSALRVW